MKKLLTFILTFLTISAAHSQVYWQQISSFPGTLRHAAGSFSLNGYGYVAGGYGVNNLVLNDVWKYDPVNDSWAQANNLPLSVYEPTIFTINDTVYLTNGWISTAQIANNNLYRYDELSDQWDSISVYPGYPAYTCASFVLNGKAYVGIGYPYSNQLWQYNPATNAWAAKADLPGQGRQSTSAFVINNRAFVGLGAETTTAYDDFYEYIDSSDTWVPFGVFPGGARYAASCMVINDKVYIACGATPAGQFFNDMWVLDSYTMTWSQSTNYSGGPRHSTAEFVVNNIGFSGLGRTGTFLPDMWRLVPAGPNEIRGFAYYDANSNLTPDSTEYPATQLLVEVNPGGKIYSTSSEGIFKAVADTQITYTFNVLNVPQYYSVGATLNPITLTSFGTIDSSTIIPLLPSATNKDLKIDLTAFTPARGGFEGYYTITYKNIGTTTMDTVNIHLMLDPNLNFQFTLPTQPNPTYSANNDTLSWQFYSLIPGETRAFSFQYYASTSLMNGDTVNSSAYIDPLGGDVDTTNNFSNVSQDVVGSYDPNDKTVSDLSISPQDVLNGKWLTYTIRFQNTGTYQANYVRIIDSIFAELDLSTFEMISASHPYTYEINGDRNIKWNFPGIVLPDSNTNEPQSHGFIKFRIKPITSLTTGNLIANYASIYFDFNPAIYTNIAFTDITNTQSIKENGKQIEFGIYPNPAKDIIYFNNDVDITSISMVQIYDSYGRKVRTYEKLSSNSINLPTLAPGIYKVQLIFKNGNQKSTSLMLK